jgi:hypothetical protein
MALDQAFDTMRHLSCCLWYHGCLDNKPGNWKVRVYLMSRRFRRASQGE